MRRRPARVMVAFLLQPGALPVCGRYLAECLLFGRSLREHRQAAGAAVADFRSVGANLASPASVYFSNEDAKRTFGERMV